MIKILYCKYYNNEIWGKLHGGGASRAGVAVILMIMIIITMIITILIMIVLIIIVILVILIIEVVLTLPRGKSYNMMIQTL